MNPSRRMTLFSPFSYFFPFRFVPFFFHSQAKWLDKRRREWNNDETTPTSPTMQTTGERFRIGKTPQEIYKWRERDPKANESISNRHNNIKLNCQSRERRQILWWHLPMCNLSPQHQTPNTCQSATASSALKDVNIKWYSRETRNKCKKRWFWKCCCCSSEEWGC